MDYQQIYRLYQRGEGLKLIAFGCWAMALTAVLLTASVEGSAKLLPIVAALVFLVAGFGAASARHRLRNGTWW